jgi:cytochrome c
MSSHTRPALLAAILFVCGCGAPSGPAPSSAPPHPAESARAGPAPAQGIYAEAQAERGRGLFREACAECHYSSEFRDQQFRFKWGRRTVRDLYREIVRNMPEDDPGGLPDRDYVDIVTYILQLNGFPAGNAELPADEDVMAGYPMTPPAPGGTR